MGEWIIQLLGLTNQLNTDYWYDSDSPYSVFSSKNSVNIYSHELA